MLETVEAGGTRVEATDVYGLLPEDRLESVQETLARRGLGPPLVEAQPAAPGRYQLHDEMLHEDASAARRGAAAGLVVGAVLGLAVALALPQLTATSTIVGVIAAFAGLGGLVGGVVGLQRVESGGSDPVAYRDVAGDEHLVLVQVHDEHWHNKAHRIMERHGAVFVQGPTPV